MSLMSSSNPNYERYYMQQSGTGLPVYAGRRHQRGHGLGGLLKGVVRNILPAVLPAAKEIGTRTLNAARRSAIREGVGFVGDVLAGHNLKQAAVKRLANAGKATVGGFLGNTNASIKRRATSQPNIPAKVRKQSRPNSNPPLGRGQGRGRGRGRGGGRGRGRSSVKDIFS